MGLPGVIYSDINGAEIHRVIILNRTLMLLLSTRHRRIFPTFLTHDTFAFRLETDRLFLSPKCQSQVGSGALSVS